MKKAGRTGLRRSSPPRVALIIETTMSYGRRLLQGVAEYVSENGPWSVYFDPRSPYDPALPSLDNWDGDGIITRVLEPKITGTLTKTSIPVVNLNATISTGVSPPLILNDQDAIGQMGARHLLDRGFKQFGFVGFPGFAWSDQRYQGFREAVEEAGFDCRQYLCGSGKNESQYHPQSWDKEILRLADWVRKRPKPIGLLASHDFRAVHLLDACHRSNVAVPEEVAVVGIDNESIACELCHPPLTSIIPDHRRMGREAAALLDRLMKGESPPEKEIRIPPIGIVTRKSTDVMAIDDPMVAKAISFIREHAFDGINVNDLLRHMLVSRSSLQIRFRKAVNRSILDVILDVRIERVKALLSRSELSLRGIADRTGFTHVEYMSTVFKKRTGTTLSQYRKKHKPIGIQQLLD